MSSLILVRFGEIWTKGHNKEDFINQLVKNLKQFGKPKLLRTRILIDGNLEKIANVPGVESASEGKLIPKDLNKLKKEARKLLGDAETFAVRTKRVDKSYELKSIEINELIGDYLSKFAKVNLTNPEKVIGIEVLQNGFFIFDKTIRGPGGLPVGVSGKCISLVSSGIDSAVATWMMMRRGCEPIIVHMNIANSKEAFTKIFKRLQEFHPKMKAYIIPFEEIVSKYKVQTRSWCLICKRLMLRIAEEIAEKEGAEAIIMGDSLGQVASQTIHNMKIIEKATNMLIFKPLIGLNKNEIIGYAKRIGTYELAEDFQCPMVPKKPVTHGKLKLVEKIEEEMPIEFIVKKAVSSAKVVH